MDYDCAERHQLIERLQSKVIDKEINSIINSIKDKIGLFDFVLAQSINSICNLKFSYSEIKEYTGVSDSLIRSYSIDQNVRELLVFTENELILSSSIFAQYLVREAGMRGEMLNMLEKIYICCSNYDDPYGRYYQQRRNMVNRANILLLLNCDGDNELSNADEESVLKYYDNIKNLPTASQNPFFWLQFGITALNLEKYQFATINFDNAYTNAKAMHNFDTFQIDTHKARLLLCKEMSENSNDASSALAVFDEANKLLLNNGNKGDRLKYVLRQVGIYYDYFSHYLSIWTSDDIDKFRINSFKINDRFTQYFLEVEDGKISPEVADAYLKYRRIFENTSYVLMLKNVDKVYNNKIGRIRPQIRG